MEVWHWKQFIGTCSYPIFPIFTLTFGTMPIAAAIITDTDCPTVIAGIDMSAQGGRPAFFDSM
jgi:hypothetical protein